MNTIYLQVIGCGIFTMCIFVLGSWLRRHPSKKAAETTSRIAHFFFFIALLLPLVIGVSSPVLTHYDELLGIPSLPFPAISLAAGTLMMLIGSGFMFISIVVLLDRGQGLPAFELSKKLAVKDIYKYTRNPMALGFNLIYTSIGLVAGSLFFTLFSLTVVLPVIVFFLKYFEERELEIRFEQPYREYKKNVPFLIPGFRRSYKAESLENGEPE